MSLPTFIGLRYTASKPQSQSVAFLARVSMIGMAVGVALLVLVLSVMNGFDRELRNRILALVPQAAVYHREGIEDWETLSTEIASHKDVEGVSPFIQLQGLVSAKGKTLFVSLYGFDAEAEKKVSLINEYVDDSVQKRLSNNEPLILLGRDVANELSVGVGDKIMTVVPKKGSGSKAPELAYFEVGQILHTQTELDATLALTSLQQAQLLSNNKNVVTGLKLKLNDLFVAPQVVNEIKQALGYGYYTSNWTRTHWNLYQAIQMSKSLVGLLMSLIVAIAAFNVVSTLVLVVVDKQGDIAILRTMGATHRLIIKIFLTMGLGIAVIGICGGIILGCLFALGAGAGMAGLESFLGVQFLKSDVYPLTYLPTEVRVADLVSVSITAIVLSVLATLYPAWKASKVLPAEALRYE